MRRSSYFSSHHCRQSPIAACRSYNWRKWLCVLLITAGIALFMFKNKVRALHSSLIVRLSVGCAGAGPNEAGATTAREGLLRMT